jgi:adenylate cyclase
MPFEIERKFLVIQDRWRRPDGGVRYRQGYLTTDPGRSVRIRSAAGKGVITIKGMTANRRRPEYEYTIPLADAEELLDTLCLRPLIEKSRYIVEHAGLRWEIDEFEGVNAGLVIAEVELADADQCIHLPEWVGEEVTDDPRYYNASLIEHPYSTWGGRPAH